MRLNNWPDEERALSFLPLMSSLAQVAGLCQTFQVSLTMPLLRCGRVGDAGAAREPTSFRHMPRTPCRPDYGLGTSLGDDAALAAAKGCDDADLLKMVMRRAELAQANRPRGPCSPS